ncbi:hypothetical protein L204_103481 [Cryptococcus depauperatus]
MPETKDILYAFHRLAAFQAHRNAQTSQTFTFLALYPVFSLSTLERRKLCCKSQYDLIFKASNPQKRPRCSAAFL